MKKLISMILAVAVLASSVLLINATAADPKGTLVGKSVSGGPGETVEIPVTVDTASTAGVVALGISIGYDQGNLELVSWTNGDFFPAAALTASETIPKLTNEVKTGDDAKVEVVIDSDEPFTGYTEVKVGEVATSEADKVDGKDVVGGYKIDIIDADTNEPVAAGKKVKAKIKLTDAMKAAYKDFDVAIDGTALGATVTEDGYLTFTAEAGKLAKVVVVGTKIETNGGNNGSNSGENNGNSGSSTSPKTGEATGAALAVTLFAAAAAGVVLSKKKRG